MRFLDGLIDRRIHGVELGYRVVVVRGVGLIARLGRVRWEIAVFFELHFVGIDVQIYICYQ